MGEDGLVEIGGQAEQRMAQIAQARPPGADHVQPPRPGVGGVGEVESARRGGDARRRQNPAHRSEEHTSELQSLMRISYAVFCLKKKKTNKPNNIYSA